MRDHCSCGRMDRLDIHPALRHQVLRKDKHHWSPWYGRGATDVPCATNARESVEPTIQCDLGCCRLLDQHALRCALQLRPQPRGVAGGGSSTMGPDEEAPALHDVDGGLSGGQAPLLQLRMKWEKAKKRIRAHRPRAPLMATTRPGKPLLTSWRPLT